MTEFRPGTSPPPVRIPIRFADMKMLLKNISGALKVHSIEDGTIAALKHLFVGNSVEAIMMP
jgi:hypothetical protein